MNDLSLIQDLGIIWLAALLAGHLSLKLKQPIMAGYMIAGIVIGPHSLGLISKTEQIEVLAQFGVAMLLFALGVDLSLKQITSSAKKIVAAGSVQMIATVAVGWILSLCFNLATDVASGFLFGCVCAISSSVIISKVLTERGETESIHGRILIPLSLVQDLSLVLIIAVLPLLQNGATSSITDLLLSIGKSVAFIGMVYLGALKVVPHFFNESVKSNSKELFLLTVIVLCLSVALLSSSLGLSIALGAFLAGIMISESPYVHQALTNIIPLRDLFATVFFVSIGMLLNPQFIVQHWAEVILFVILLVGVKAAIGAMSARFATKNIRSEILVGIGLAQIGEFSFVLLSLGHEQKLITSYMYDLFFAGAIVTLVASPALSAIVPRLLNRFKLFTSHGAASADENFPELVDHVVICGFGRTGKNIGMVLAAHSIPFVVIELSGGIVQDLTVKEFNHIYGDAISPIVLEKAGIERAACLVITTPDANTTACILSHTKLLNPNLTTLARAHRSDDIKIFKNLGVSGIVQPEFEASSELTRLALQSLRRSSPEIRLALNSLRDQRYRLFQPEQSLKVESSA